jgi:acylphosphatase
LETERRHIAIKIYGDMKATGIRFSTMHEAFKSGVFGVIKYNPEGSVHIEAEGFPEQIERFEAWCCKTAAKYNNAKIEINSDKLIGYNEFNIID